MPRAVGVACAVGVAFAAAAGSHERALLVYPANAVLHRACAHPRLLLSRDEENEAGASELLVISYHYHGSRDWAF